MRGEIVAIDLETTGLTWDHDHIIEIGAVRMREGEIVDEFTTLVNPGCPIPDFITQLTSIRDEDVLDAPGIHAVIPLVRGFVGSSPWIAHNISFDWSFLRPHGILQSNLRIDTYELASVLLPRVPRYNLGSLSQQLGIELESAHRALNDARATAHLYWQLWQKALALPLATLREIVNLAQDLAWDARPVFEAALQERMLTADEPALFSLDSYFAPETSERRPLRPRDLQASLDPETVLSALDKDGALARALPEYEHRAQQMEMAHEITDAFNQGRHLMIEAGTGTGKSLGYLVPSILWSALNHERVVISTNTINLQEQLLNKDIPALHGALDVQFRAAVMKGRGNYLCPRRLAAARRRRPTNSEEMRTLAKILVWLLESPTGDRGEITLRGPEENATWNRLSADDEGCTLERCQTMMGGACPFFKARKAAEAANVLIVNHALLIADAATENRVLPEYRYLVIDEGHHLEDATTNGMSFRLDENTLRRRLSELGGPRRGLLGSILTQLRGVVSERDLEKLERYVDDIGMAIAAMDVHISAFFRTVRGLLADMKLSPSDYSAQIRVVEQTRSMSAFTEIQLTWQTLEQFVDGISEALRSLAASLNRFGESLEDFDDLVTSVSTAARYLGGVHQHIESFANQPDPNTIYWISAGQDLGHLVLNSAPLHVGPLVEEHLWNTKESVIVTSATLQTNGSFDYLCGRLNADSARTVELGSPFDYRASTLIYVPKDMPDPSDKPHYQRAVERGIIELATALDGRVLALFTSYAQLRQTANAIAPRLKLGGITVYDQSDGSSRQALLDGFKTSERAVLLGTKSFWEGVDIPGEALSALVIVKLPFSVPTDPVFAARSETVENAFNNFALPDAILRFRQGFGRLIRTKTDRGIVAIFDSRVLTKTYGGRFIEALPDCAVEYGPLADLADAAVAWLERPRSAAN